MTKHQTTIFSAQVHTIAFAEVEHFAVFARLCLSHPIAVAVLLKAILPHIPELIMVDIPLVVLTSDTGASRDTAIDENRGDGYACGTLVEMVAHLAFVVAKKALARVTDMTTCLSLGHDEIHQLVELVVVEYEFGMLRCAPHGIDTKDTPIACAQAPNQVAYLGQMIDIALVSASNDIPCQVFFRRRKADSAACALESERVLPKPNMVIFQSVEADCH